MKNQKTDGCQKPVPAKTGHKERKSYGRNEAAARIQGREGPEAGMAILAIIPPPAAMRMAVRAVFHNFRIQRLRFFTLIIHMGLS